MKVPRALTANWRGETDEQAAARRQDQAARQYVARRSWLAWFLVAGIVKGLHYLAVYGAPSWWPGQ